MATTKTTSRPKKTEIPTDKLEEVIEAADIEAVEPVSTPKRVGNGFVDCDRLNIRKGMGLDCLVLTILEKDSPLTVTDDFGEWLELDFMGEKAYCMSEFVRF